jgi:hypothetical protein
MAGEINTISVPKGFLSRPEGKVGLVVPVVSLVLVIYFFGSAIGDFIVNAVDNIFHLIIVGTASVALLWMLFDSKFRTLVFYLYRSLMRWITSMFIDIDPIGVLKTYKERLKGKLDEMDQSIQALDSQKVKVERIIRGNDGKIRASMELVAQAIKKGDERTKGLEGKQATRLSDQNVRLGGDFNRIRFLLEVLNRYRQLSSDTITDMEREIQVRQVERDYSRSSRNVVRAAMGILKGLPEKDMWDEGLDTLERQYSEAIGEVDHFLDITKDILAKADLQDGADAERAMQMLETWQTKNASVIFGGIGNQMSKKDIIQQAAKQISAPSATITLSNNKPNYSAVPVKNNDSSGDDYLSLVG